MLPPNQTAQTHNKVNFRELNKHPKLKSYTQNITKLKGIINQQFQHTHAWYKPAWINKKHKTKGYSRFTRSCLRSRHPIPSGNSPPKIYNKIANAWQSRIEKLPISHPTNFTCALEIHWPLRRWTARSTNNNIPHLRSHLRWRLRRHPTPRQRQSMLTCPISPHPRRAKTRTRPINPHLRRAKTMTRPSAPTSTRRR
jgi:hypothetical protein